MRCFRFVSDIPPRRSAAQSTYERHCVANFNVGQGFLGAVSGHLQEGRSWRRRQPKFRRRSRSAALVVALQMKCAVVMVLIVKLFPHVHWSSSPRRCGTMSGLNAGGVVGLRWPGCGPHTALRVVTQLLSIHNGRRRLLADGGAAESCLGGKT